jgi:hypothetical protein
VVASGWEYDGSTPQPPEQAVDGNASTIWKSRNLDNEWIYVDLGGSKSINSVVLKWDWAYPSAYKIQISTQVSNPTTWNDVYSTTTFTGGSVTNAFTAVSATFCRLLCVTRAVLFGQQWQNKLFELEVYGPSGTPPSITTQPANQSVTEGQTATFSVVATGSTPLSYQWRKSAVNISGATSSSYTTPPTVAADNGAVFSVVVSNPYGSVTSANATLTVTSGGTPPAAPTNLSATAGKKRVTLHWVQSTSPSITQNKIYRSTTGSGGPYSLRATVSATTSHTETGLTSGQQYFYVATAVNSSGQESGFSNYIGATPR